MSIYNNYKLYFRTGRNGRRAGRNGGKCSTMFHDCGTKMFHGTPWAMFWHKVTSPARTAGDPYLNKVFLP